MTDTVLILGARGRFGLAVARAFAQAGGQVWGHTRPGAAVPEVAGVRWLGIELADTAALAAAARGATVVVHALNPGAYTRAAWQAQALPMTDAALAVARALGATLMLPGNVYNFGADMPARLCEDTPQRAHTVMGQVRIAMEARLAQSGVRAVVVRAGDFFGSGRGTWFDRVMVPKLPQGLFTYPGARDVPTAWAYLPDLARAFVAVARRRERLAAFDTLHFAGHTLTAQQWLDVLTPLARTQGWVNAQAALRLRSLPWPLIRAGALLVPAWAALADARAQWQRPHALDNTRLRALIGPEPHTPLPAAALAALTELGLLAGPCPPEGG